jgi:hypothetical protein
VGLGPRGDRWWRWWILCTRIAQAERLEVGSELRAEAAELRGPQQIPETCDCSSQPGDRPLFDALPGVVCLGSFQRSDRLVERVGQEEQPHAGVIRVEAPRLVETPLRDLQRHLGLSQGNGLLTMVEVPEDDMGNLMGDEGDDGVRHLPRQVDDEVDDGDAHVTVLVLPARASPVTGYLGHTPLEANEDWVVGEKRLRIEFGDAAEDGEQGILQVQLDNEAACGAPAGAIQPLPDASGSGPVGWVVAAHVVSAEPEMEDYPYLALVVLACPFGHDGHSGRKASTSSSP